LIVEVTVLLLFLAIALTVLKLAAIAPVADWSWWVPLSFYAATAVWWALADAIGYTQWRQGRRTRRKQREREAERRRALGLDRRSR